MVAVNFQFLMNCLNEGNLTGFLQHLLSSGTPIVLVRLECNVPVNSDTDVNYNMYLTL